MRRSCEDFLRWELRSWRRRHGRDPRNIFEWRRRNKTAINVFLRFVHGHWPVVATPATAIEAFHRDLVQGYDAWMRDLRGLASVTRSKRTTQALEFLTELGPRGEQESLAQLARSAMSMRTCSSVARVGVGKRSRATRCAFEASCAICTAADELLSI